jgi:muramidase (phage lysozyme)
MSAARPERIGGKNVAAFLDMLAVSEGTDDGRQETKHQGYDVLVGGGLFHCFDAHPNKLVRLAKLGISSTAAGRYQFLKRTWDDVARSLSLTDFSPVSQDLGAVKLLEWTGALQEIKAGNFEAAVHRCRKIWASLPGAGYGQHEQKISRLRAAYLAAGGKIGEAA